MGAPFKLIAGLGNPGPEYRATRHNAGFWVAESLAALWRVSLKAGRWEGIEGKASPAGLGPVLLLLPQTYMNESGRSLAPLARFYKLAPSDVVVIHDDLDLAPGRLRLKQGGGDGGHNGIKSIVEHWSERDFYRLRVGVGRPPRGGNVVEYVLSRPPSAEREKLEKAVERAGEAAESLLRSGLQAAQQRFNRDAD